MHIFGEIKRQKWRFSVLSVRTPTPPPSYFHLHSFILLYPSLPSASLSLTSCLHLFQNFPFSYINLAFFRIYFIYSLLSYVSSQSCSDIQTFIVHLPFSPLPSSPLLSLSNVMFVAIFRFHVSSGKCFISGFHSLFI